MFQQIRYRLLLSYLVVLTIVLGTFAIAVRIVFARSLSEELDDRLAILAKASAGELDLEDGQLSVDGKDLLIQSNQGVEWFDSQGKSIERRGNKTLALAFDRKHSLQVQKIPDRAHGITLPVIAEEDEDKSGEVIGYVRASESFEQIDRTLQRLDWGLGGGIVLGLAMSGFGGIWLTRQAMQPIEKSFQKLQQFTADASHELRSPLMAIKANAAVALKYSEGIRNSDREKFQAIASATTQMTALTEDLLMLARTDRTLQQNCSFLDLRMILEQLIQLYKPYAETKQIELKIQITDPLYIYGDSVQISRLFTNLLDNALRYTPEGGQVNVFGNCEGRSIVVSIQDTGIGIASDQLDRIFDRFWRADRSRSYTDKGFGLGLAIAQNIANDRGGSISVTSELGSGSCFTVRLPVNS